MTCSGSRCSRTEALGTVLAEGAAIAWARQDVALRRSGSTLSLLAWCLFRGGRTAEALAVLDEAFPLGAGDPQRQARAREIRRSATETAAT